VAVAETRAEGRALRRALRLRKVVAAEEIAKDMEDHPDQNSVSKISHNQINFVDVMAQRLNISVIKLLESNQLVADNIYNLLHEDAVKVIRQLSKFQQNISEIPENILGYSSDWK
jgi:Na+/phosphate symporter